MDYRLVILFAGMAFVTYLPRMLPLVMLSQMELPELMMKWLEYIPASILAALLFPVLLAPEGQFYLGFGNRFLLAALPTVVIGIKTRSLVKTVSTGIISMFIINNLL